jgi:hypothetical protein
MAGCVTAISLSVRPHAHGFFYSINSVLNVEFRINSSRNLPRRGTRCHQRGEFDRYAMDARLRGVALRWKNNAWLTIADTMAGAYGFDIRNAGSGRCPVKNRSG